jgi:DNA invertase Pin-like site-specific DNA recombinase
MARDLSRLGRNYIEVGKLTEEFFPEYDIRLVAVSDGVDTDEGENDLNPIRNLFNEWYSRDISKKRRISNKVKGNAGEPLSPPPYGYMKNPDLDPKSPVYWVIDPEAAQIVRRIYQMSIDGKPAVRQRPASASPMKVKKISSAACLSALIATTIYGSISIKATTTSHTSTAPITRETAALARQHITYGLTSLNG